MSRLSMRTFPLGPLTAALAAVVVCCGTAARAQSTSSSGTSRERAFFRAPEDSGIEAIAVSTDAELVAALSLKHVGLFTNRGSINVREASTGKSRFSADLGEVLRPDCASVPHTVGEPSRISFSPNGRFVAAGAVGCSVVKCWDVASGKECLSFLSRPPVARQWFRSLWFSDDSQRLGLDLPREAWYLGADAWEEELVFFETKSWASPSKVRVPCVGAYGTPGAVSSTYLRADRSRFCSVNHESRKLAVWDVRGDQPRLVERRLLPGAEDRVGPDPVGECTFSRDGSLIFFSGSIIRSGEAKLASLPLAGHDGGPFDSVEFSPDGTLLAGIRFRIIHEGSDAPGDAAPAQTGSTTRKSEVKSFGDVFLWNTKTGKRVAAWTRPEWWPKSVAIFPKNDRILLSDGTEVAVWQVAPR
jgi:WD40 repeat protein